VLDAITKLCVCSSSTRELYKLTTYIPDVTSTLITPTTVVFDSFCLATSSLSQSGTCLTEITKYYTPSMITTTVTPTTNFGSFYISFKNSGTATISTACSLNLKADGYLFEEIS